MTRAEAIERLNCLNNKCDPYECIDVKCYKCDEAVEMAIEALQQEPSREYDYSKSVWENIQEGNGISKDIPKEPKRGEWLPIIEGNEFGEPYQSGIYCSECGETLRYEANYCPNCGAKMKE